MTSVGVISHLPNVGFAMAAERTALASALAFLGRFSLEIYLAHPLWGTASRGLLLRSGVHLRRSSVLRTFLPPVE